MIERIYTCTCDECAGTHRDGYLTDDELEGAQTQAEVIRRARARGWLMGKRHVCPSCRKGADDGAAAQPQRTHGER